MIKKAILIFSIMLCLLSNPVTAQTGFTVTSISQDGDYFLINLIIDGSGESIGGYIYPENFNIPGIKVQEKLKISISKATELLNYAVSNKGTLWKYTDPVYYDRLDYWHGAVCPVKPAHCYKIDIPWEFGEGNDRIVVTSLTPGGSYGGLENPDISILQTIGIKINNTEYKENIGTGETTRSNIQFKGVPLSIRIVGLILTGRGYPNQNLYVATHRIETSRWNIAPVPYYEQYVKSLTESSAFLRDWNEQEPVLEPWDGEQIKAYNCKDVLCSTLVNLVTEHNSNVDKLLSKSVSIDYGAATAVQSSVSGYDSHIYDSLDRPITNTEMIIRIKGSLLRTIILSGEPKIIKIESPDFVSGENNGYIRIYLQNIGTVQGTFTSRTNNTFESDKITLQPGEAGSLTLFLRSGVNATQVKAGDIEVYDIASGSNDTAEYQLNITTPKLFIPNETRIYNEIITKAEPDGLSEYKILDLSGDHDQDGTEEDPQVLRWDGSKYSSESVDDVAEKLETRATPTPAPQALYLPPVKPPENPSFDFMWVIVLILAFILVIFLVNSFGNSRQRSKKGFPLVPVLLGLGILAGVVLFALYWDNVQAFANEMIIKYAIENIIK